MKRLTRNRERGCWLPGQTGRGFFAFIMLCGGVASVALPIDYASAQNKPQNKLMAADLIIVNATVHTMDPGTPTASAVAVHGNRVSAGGSTAEIRQLGG